MKKKITNMLIIIIIIAGIIGVWFIKNRDVFSENVQNEYQNIKNDIEAKDIEKLHEEIGSIDVEDINEENKDNEVEPVVEQINKDDANFELESPSFNLETLTSYGLPILLDFGAEWCGPCQLMYPILEELNDMLRGKAIIKYVDIDEYPEIADGFNFALIPTQYFITKDGEIYKTHTGILSKEDAINILKEMGMAK